MDQNQIPLPINYQEKNYNLPYVKKHARFISFIVFCLFTIAWIYLKQEKIDFTDQLWNVLWAALAQTLLLMYVKEPQIYYYAGVFLILDIIYLLV